MHDLKERNSDLYSEELLFKTLRNKGRISVPFLGAITEVVLHHFEWTLLTCQKLTYEYNDFIFPVLDCVR